MNLLRVKWGSNFTAPATVKQHSSVKTDAGNVCGASVFLFGKFFNMQSDNITNIKEIKSTPEKHFVYHLTKEEFYNESCAYSS